MSAQGNPQVSYAFLKKTSLFRGTTEEELPTLLGCIAPTYRDFAKNEIILHQGEEVANLPIKQLGDEAPEYDRPWREPGKPAPLPAKLLRRCTPRARWHAPMSPSSLTYRSTKSSSQLP